MSDIFLAEYLLTLQSMLRTVVATFFEPSIASVIDAISNQLQRPHRPITVRTLNTAFDDSH